MDGTVRIVAIIVPLIIISLIFSLELEGSDNMIIVKSGYKNQRYFIFGGHGFVFACQATKKHIQMNNH